MVYKIIILILIFGTILFSIGARYSEFYLGPPIKEEEYTYLVKLRHLTAEDSTILSDPYTSEYIPAFSDRKIVGQAARGLHINFLLPT